MQRIEIDVPMDFDLIDHGDTHFGDILCHHKGIDKIVQYVEADKKHRRWLHKGDWIEAITTDDKRFSEDTTDKAMMTPADQKKAIVKKYRPIKDQGIVGLLGNHEWKLHRVTNFAKDICDDLGIAYGTYSCRVIFNSGKRKLFNGYFTHGRWGFNSNAKDYEQRLANRKAMLKMRLKYKMGDCAIMSCGHAHQLLVVPPTKQVYLHDTVKGLKAEYLVGKQSGDFIDPDHRWYGCSGSTLKLYEDGVNGYGEIAGYDPAELGFIVWKIRDGIITEGERVIL